MIKKLWILLVVFLFFGQAASGQVLQTLSGFAISVDPKAQELRVLFEHPVTGENLLKVFKVLPTTGFKNVKRLDQIKPQDPVSVDYEKSENAELQAVYIEVVSLDRAPFDENQVGKYLSFFSR